MIKRKRNNRWHGVWTFEESVNEFWLRVASVNLDDPTKCWEWNGYKDPRGYGRCSFQGKKMLAHRASWLVHSGAIPEGLGVLHRCDNPPCVNPNHLFLGTAKDNAQDMSSKGRSPVHQHPDIIRMGEKHHGAKLKEADIVEICNSTESNVKLAKKFGVHHANISNIRKGKIWKNVKLAVRSTGHRNAKLTKDQVLQILDSDVPNKVIAAQFGVTASNISQIRLRKSWAHIQPA